MAIASETRERATLPHPDVQRLGDVNRDILRIMQSPGRGWWALFALAVVGVGTRTLGPRC